MPNPGPHTHAQPPSTATPASTTPTFPPSAAGDRTALLAELRARIRGLEGVGGEGARTLPFGVDAVDSALPGGGLPLGCLHEVTAEDPGVGTAFAAGLLARLAVARPMVWPVVWIVRGRDLHAAGLAAYGLTPDRLIAVRARCDADALWAMEEALRCPHLSAVLGEAGKLDLTASRRLQLAAESSGVTGLLLQLGAGRSVSATAAAATAAVTRWHVAPAPAGEEADHGVGEPRWRVALERCRGGRPGAWLLDWRDGGLAEAMPHTAPSHLAPTRRLMPSTLVPGPAASAPAHPAAAWTAVA